MVAGVRGCEGDHEAGGVLNGSKLRGSRRLPIGAGIEGVTRSYEEDDEVAAAVVVVRHEVWKAMRKGEKAEGTLECESILAGCWSSRIWTAGCMHFDRNSLASTCWKCCGGRTVEQTGVGEHAG